VAAVVDRKSAKRVLDVGPDRGAVIIPNPLSASPTGPAV
jgi:hypothetical protein